MEGYTAKPKEKKTIYSVAPSSRPKFPTRGEGGNNFRQSHRTLREGGGGKGPCGPGVAHARPEQLWAWQRQVISPTASRSTDKHTKLPFVGGRDTKSESSSSRRSLTNLTQTQCSFCASARVSSKIVKLQLPPQPCCARHTQCASPSSHGLAQDQKGGGWESKNEVR